MRRRASEAPRRIANRRQAGALGWETDMIDSRINLPGYIDRDIRQKMRELAIELRYLAADGTLNNPKLALTLTDMLEKCAQAEGSDTDIRDCQIKYP